MDPQEVIDTIRAELQVAKAAVLAAKAETRKRDIHLEAIKQGAASPHHVAALAPSEGSPAEAIQAMRDSGEHDNLFNGIAERKQDVTKLSPSEYRRLRKENPQAVGL